MPTNVIRLKTAIKTALQANLPGATAEQIAALETTSAAIAAAIIVEILDVNITYTTGLAAPPSGGAVTGSFTYTIS